VLGSIARDAPVSVPCLALLVELLVELPVDGVVRLAGSGGMRRCRVSWSVISLSLRC
jgi:hypothetical protein